MTDLCGISFQGHPEPRPLVLHEGAHPSIPPLDPRYPRGEMIPYIPVAVGLAADRRAAMSRHCHSVPYGATCLNRRRSSSITSAKPFCIVIRGCSSNIAEWKSALKVCRPLLGTLIAERISGVDSVAHSLAFCQAIETASRCEIPERARYLRIILAELERLYNHLHYLRPSLPHDHAQSGRSARQAPGGTMQTTEWLFTGSRFLRGLLKPGGLRRDLNLSALSARLRAWNPRSRTIWRRSKHEQPS